MLVFAVSFSWIHIRQLLSHVSSFNSQYHSSHFSCNYCISSGTDVRFFIGFVSLGWAFTLILACHPACDISVFHFEVFFNTVKWKRTLYKPESLLVCVIFSLYPYVRKLQSRLWMSYLRRSPGCWTLGVPFTAMCNSCTLLLKYLIKIQKKAHRCIQNPLPP